jgi:hypothetical protein
MKRWLVPLLLSLPATLYAESGAYRIEVLVFNHLEGAAEPLEIEALRSFRDAFPLDGALLKGNAGDPAPLGVMSDMMEDAWRRLRLGAAYRPLLFVVWEQSRIDFHPPVRVHGEDVIARRLLFPGGMAWVDLRSEDMFAPYRAPYFRLDGTVQMRRSRFLHLDLDLEYRDALVPAGTPLPASAAEAEMLAATSAPVAEPPPGPALVHALHQTRQVRTGELQYFDTPYLGVLARVTATAGE